MATYLTTIQVGQKKYHISHSNENLYFSSSSKSSGNSLKGLKFKNNEIISTKSGKSVTEFDIAEAIKKSSSSSGCFISTVVYKTISLNDDCDELMKLREFRDEVMLKDRLYSNLVDEYYMIAPEIANILMEKDDIELCQHLSNEYIKKSINLIDSEQYDEAITVYKNMVNFLQINLM